ncbi:hypothetical protein SSCG_04975 [Streptomyces clavuligerus]|nr:hypothetical protein SSCG_04975 [Streptomyces clavuligerus]
MKRENTPKTRRKIKQAKDVLNLIDGDVAVIGGDPTEVALAVLDRMLAAGGELVTLVLGDAAPAPAPAPERLERHVRDTHLAVDTVTYHAGRGSPLLLIGVE